MLEIAKKTTLYQYHKKNAVKISSFANYAMPIYYKYGAIEEHNWTRKNASIFDVSHMVQLLIKDSNVIKILEKITPSLFQKMTFNKIKYSLILNKNGGILDDWLITKLSDTLFYAVINANNALKTIQWLKDHFETVQLLNKSLIALQGPESNDILCKIMPDIILPKKFEFSSTQWNNVNIGVSCTGYTGENGFELSIENNTIVDFWNTFLSIDKVRAAGLAARDSLRLEAGYPLYGNDINNEMTPVEANLSWLVKNTNCYGGSIIENQLHNGVKFKRIGFKLNKKRIPRNNNIVLDMNNNKIGNVTSAVFLPGKNFVAGQMYVKSNVNIGDLIKINFSDSALDAQVHGLIFLN